MAVRICMECRIFSDAQCAPLQGNALNLLMIPCNITKLLHATAFRFYFIVFIMQMSHSCYDEKNKRADEIYGTSQGLDDISDCSEAISIGEEVVAVGYCDKAGYRT